MERENQSQMSLEEMSVLTESNVNEDQSIGLNSEDQSTNSSVFLSSTRPPPPNYYYHHPTSVNSGVGSQYYNSHGGLAFTNPQPPLTQIDLSSSVMQIDLGLRFDSNSRDGDDGDDEREDLDEDGETKEDDGRGEGERSEGLSLGMVGDGDDIYDDVTMEDDLTATTATSPPMTTATTATLTTATTMRPPPIPTTVDVPITAMSAPPHHPLPPPPPLPSSVPSTVTLPATLPALHPPIVRVSNSHRKQEEARQEEEEERHWRHSEGDIEERKAPPSPTPLPLVSIEPSGGGRGVNNNEYYCQICFDTYDRHTPQAYELSNCRHVFCHECLVQFLKSKIETGQVYPKCFYMTEIHTAPNHLNPATPKPSERHRTSSGSASSLIQDEGKREDVEYEVVNQRTIIEHLCNEEISSVDIQLLLKGEKDLLEKYNRFKFCRENKNARECPSCHTFQLGTPDVTPRIQCSNCQTTFCYYHSNAHNFDQFPTCEAYEASISNETKLNNEFIQTFSKPCPNCGVMVQKTGGCNHMKCQCGVAFCWLCGKAIDDNLFPAHFQWWNPTGCSNLQMNEALEPSMCARIGARILAIVQIVLLGPITLASTLASTLLCLSCICIRIKQTNPSPSSLFSTAARNEFQNIVSNCMSSWGIVWMILLIFLPLGLATGGLLLGVGIALIIVLYPCYASSRIYRGEYPWPDWVTNLAIFIGDFFRWCCRPCSRRCVSFSYNCRRVYSRLARAPPPPPPDLTSLTRTDSSRKRKSAYWEDLEADIAREVVLLNNDDPTKATNNQQTTPKKKKRDNSLAVSFDDDTQVIDLESGEMMGKKNDSDSGLIPDDSSSPTIPIPQSSSNRVVSKEELDDFNALLTMLQTKIEILEQLEANSKAGDPLLPVTPAPSDAAPLASMDKDESATVKPLTFGLVEEGAMKGGEGEAKVEGRREEVIEEAKEIMEGIGELLATLNTVSDR